MFPFESRAQCAQEGVRGLTVTKKVRLKQSTDMNWKAWDNNAAAYGLPLRLLLVLKDRGRLRRCATSGLGFVPTLPFHSIFGWGGRLIPPGMKEGCSGEKVLARER